MCWQLTFDFNFIVDGCFFHLKTCLAYIHNITYIHLIHAVFDITLDEKGREEHPLVAMTHPRECILEPGEVLFVPAGSPHQVQTKKFK